MAKMWAGVTDGTTAKIADDFNSSVGFDKRMFREDIKGSIAHAEMLAECSVISGDERDLIVSGLRKICESIENGEIVIDEQSEDIHMFVEEKLTELIGDTGKKLHTARSRNDQVALDLRLYLLKEADEVIDKTKNLIAAVTETAEKNKTAIMPGYTHLQRAQPILFAHQILAYAYMLLRDIDRINDCKKRMGVSPIGSCALAGTTFSTDRFFEAERLGLGSVSENSIDGVSDRDFCVEFLSDIALLMMHLSRFAEETVLWSSWEFKFIELSDAYTTGSSIMPQKRNPDMAELIRGKTGRVYGDLVAMLTVLKGLPLAYNKDMQEDKESVFDACDTVKNCLDVFTGMVSTLKVRSDNMLTAAQKGFINATDLADYLVRKGLPFRTAYKISGQTVNRCMKDGFVLETLPLEVYKEFSDVISEDVYDAVNLETCVKTRISYGGTAPDSVDRQIASVKSKLSELS